jgi:hypothetical protein
MSEIDYKIDAGAGAGAKHVNLNGSISKERIYLAPREVSHEDFVNMRCDILRKQLYSDAVIAKFRKSGALKWPKLRILIGPTPYDIGGPVIDRMPDF